MVVGMLPFGDGFLITRYIYIHSCNSSKKLIFKGYGSIQILRYRRHIVSVLERSVGECCLQSDSPENHTEPERRVPDVEFHMLRAQWSSAMMLHCFILPYQRSTEAGG